MFENPRRGRQARNFTTTVPKILDLKSSSEQILTLESEKEIRRRLLTSSIKLAIRHSRRSRARTVKKCTKKRDARAKLLFYVINLLLFLDVLVAVVVVAITP